MDQRTLTHAICLESSPRKRNTSLSKQQFLWTTAKQKLVNTQSCAYIHSLSTHYGKGYPSDRKVTSWVRGFSVPSTTPCTYIKVYFCFDPLCLAKVLVFLLQWTPGLCRHLRLYLREQQFAGALRGRQALPIHGICRLTQEGRYGLLTWGQEFCRQEAIAQVRPEAHRVQ